MKRDPNAPLLSAIFVDYDNIYLSLKRKNEDAAKRFSKDAALWLKGLEKGRLINTTGAMVSEVPRRVVLNRCYGNPVPRRNNADNSTDMSSFPFVRHHFLRAGFEIVDCPPLTSQQKNAADIRMVMDLRDYLTHDTYFDEFIILSGDADFTPVLHRLRQHARRTVIYSNDHTAAAYAAICDGEVRELDLISLLIDGQLGGELTVAAAVAAPVVPASRPIDVQSQPSANQHRIEDLRQMIMAEVVAGIRAASGPVPLEALADRALRAIGHERTIGTAWAGSGSFRELVRIGLPSDLRLTEAAPFAAYDPARHIAAQSAAIQNGQAQTAGAQNNQGMAQQREALAAAMLDLGSTVPRFEALRAEPQRLEAVDAPVAPVEQRIAPPPARTVAPHQVQSGILPTAASPAPLAARAASTEPVLHRAPAARVAPAQSYAPPPRPDPAAALQKTISRIHEACQAPPLAPADYRCVFEAAAQEISENGLAGAQTLSAIAERAQARGVSLRREDVRFILDVVSEPDPWFKQGATANLFAGRFRNYAVARCREQGLQLSADELDLIDAWFTGAPMPDTATGRSAPLNQAQAARAPASQSGLQATPRDGGASANRWWALDEGRPQAGDPRAAQDGGPEDGADDFPRIVRTRQRG